MEQLNIFSYTLPQYKITKPIRLIELFAGIGSQAKALENLNANFENYQVIEFDKYAIASYNAIHGTNFTTQDIMQIGGSDLGIVDTDKYEYILTYSFPCQDLSLAGKQKGMAKGDNTRSGLLWEVERLLEECCGFKEHRIPPSSRSKIHSMSDWVDDYNYDIDNTKLPQVLLMENVPQLISQANISDFQKWQYKLEQLGYSNYVSLLNAKDYGIPQNRNRCFMVSILGNYFYEFPQKQELKLRLKDMLEDEVDEKYFLSDKLINFFVNNSKTNEEKGNGFRFKPIIDTNTTAKTITTNSGNRMDDNFIAIPEATKKGYAEARIGDGVDISYPNSKTRRGRVQKQMIQTLRIRKLTPKECWRLMGFSDEDYEKASKVNSNTQLYKQAGNSIVVNVLMAIFKELL